MRTAAVPVLLLALASAACDKDLDQGIDADVAAAPLGSCEVLEATIEQRAIREMNASIDEILDGLERRDDVGLVLPVPSAPAGAGTDARSGATDFSTTNTQENDVDEPDFVKNDGSRIFVLNGGSLVALAAWPPESARIQSVTPLEGQPAEMFLVGDRLAVYSRVGNPRLETFGPLGIVPGDPESFVLTVFDVSSAAPVPVYRQRWEGAYVSARRTGNSLHTVSVAPQRGPTLVYWPEQNIDWNRPGAVRDALERARAQNVTRIRAARLEDWLPRFTENERPVAQECGSYYATNASSRLGFTTVTTLDLSRLASQRQTLLTQANEVYASKDRLYVTARHTWTTPTREAQVRQNHTYIFQFDIPKDGGAVRYVAAGGVAGHIADQFSLDEEGGFLRVATTRETTVGWSRRDLTNNLFVLRPGDGRLEVVGELAGLARDERIYSARFEGTRGFVVTFRQIDPLFTFDLANPRSPRVVGELKIPGFSTYLHPLDRDHLLAIGRDVSPDGRQQGGVQLQVFDVTDFANPVVQHRHTIGDWAASSEAAYDHKAFNYFANRGLLGLPFSDWSAAHRSAFSSTLQLLRVSLAGGIVPAGAVDHGDLLPGTEGRYPGWSPQIRRSVMMDDYVYSISFGGLKVHDTRDLSRAVATVPFPIG
ncbi:MAG: beta-propeller domain-containing protein [Vicinamibacteria bacterium]